MATKQTLAWLLITTNIIWNAIDVLPYVNVVCAVAQRAALQWGKALLQGHEGAAEMCGVVHGAVALTVHGVGVREVQWRCESECRRHAGGVI